jgi:hypothetical protein
MHTRDPDEVLIRELLRPPPLEQARASHEFWQRRKKALQLYRVHARREAKEMIRLTREQVAAAERARYGTGFPGLVRRALAGEPFPWDRLGRKAAVTSVSLVVRPRRIVDAVAMVVLVIVVVVLAAKVV